MTEQSEPLTSDHQQPRHGAGYLFATGLTMGAADIVPGVSGGTMAFILGVYERLIDAIKSVDIQLLKLLLRGRLRDAFAHIHWQFLVPLLLGIALAMVTLARIVGWLLAAHTTLLFAFFFGLVLASVALISTHLQQRLWTVVVLLVAAGFAWWLVGTVPAQTPHVWPMIFLSGAIAITAMILPGLSGSFILLILGQYAYMLEALKTFNLAVITPFVAGLALGIALFSRVLSWLLDRYYQSTIAALVGFMLGSLRRIWPFKETVQTTIDRHGEVIPLVQRNIAPTVDVQLVYCAALALLGFVIIGLLHRLQARQLTRVGSD